MRRKALFVALLASAGVARAGDKPLYQPAPDWVLAAPSIDPAKLTDSSPALVLLDSQTRLKDGVAWSYVDTATRAISPQVLGQLGTIAIPWLPDRGDLIVHRAEIIRGGERIDLLKGGDRFTVLRREEMMEQRMLTGMLTATMSVEGLRVGDVLRMTLSITQRDPAWKGRVMTAAPTPALPMRIGFGRVRMLWPTADKVRWKAYAEGAAPIERRVGDMTELALPLPLAKQPDMPGDLPQRYARPPIVEASSFADWQEVSRTLAPLYTTDGLIAPGSPLAQEVAAIAAAETDPLRRTQRALDLVEDKVRYLALAMNGGGLLPQAPAKTWELRYGDCKAKTLLLLAMLRQLGIEAEAVAASAQTGGLVAERLPSVGAFDHVIVRAVVNGETLWLDGTRLGDRIEDIRDTPPFRFVLPLRAEGAALTPIAMRAAARPYRIVEVRYDQSAGVDLPSAFDATMTLRGPMAQMAGAVAGQATDEQKREFVQSILSSEVGEAQFASSAIRYDAASGVATITAAGLTSTPWQRENGRYRLTVDRAVGNLSFAPDRTRAAWRTIPVATESLDSVLYRSTIRLPKGSTGFALEGDQTLPATLGGRQVTRKVSLDKGVVVLEDRVDAIGTEIAPAELPAIRARYTQAQGRLLRVVAPADLPTRAEVIAAGTKDGRFKPIEAAFAAAIAADPDEVSGYNSRGSFRVGIGDRRGALADYGKVIELAPDVAAYLRRGALYDALGDRARAIADYQAARDLDAADDGAIGTLAYAQDRAGDRDKALALLDERIAQGDKGRFWAIGSKAEIMAYNGNAAEAIKLLDETIADRPGDASLLNSRCWVKGIGNTALDTALKDCTKAIELADDSAPVLDSRGLAYFRMGRLDDALADLDAALEQSPRMSDTLFLRAVVRKRLGKPGADTDLTAARLYDPLVDARYKRMGIIA